MFEKQCQRRDDEFVEAALDAGKREAEIRKLTVARRQLIWGASVMFLFWFTFTTLEIYLKRVNYNIDQFSVFFVLGVFQSAIGYHTDTKIKILKTVDQFAQGTTRT